MESELLVVKIAPVHIYLDAAFGRYWSSAFAIGRLFWKAGDGAIIDGTIDGTAAGVGRITQRVVKLQTGYVYTYAFAMLIGVVLILSYFTYLNGFPGGLRP